MATDLLKEEYPITILKKDQQIEGVEFWLEKDVEKRWTDNPLGVSLEYPYEFCCKRFYTYKDDPAVSKVKGWQDWDTKNIALWAHYGKNASPYLVILGNPYESFYYLSGAKPNNHNYVVLDLDGVTTGPITFLGGEENLKTKFNIAIDDVAIYDTETKESMSFNKTDYVTINIDGCYCRFFRYYDNENPVIQLVGIGNTEEAASKTEYPEEPEVSKIDPCFRCDLAGKFLKKVIILVTNTAKNLTSSTVWTISAVHDKNGNGVYRYRLIPNLDRVIQNAYFKKLVDGSLKFEKSEYNIGTAVSVTYDVEKDTYGKTWKNLDNTDKYRIMITDPTARAEEGETKTLYILGTSGPVNVDFVKLKTISDYISSTSQYTPLSKQYLVELLVVDPDYDKNYDSHKEAYDNMATCDLYSTVDKCSLLFEYNVIESGKDGTSTVFNLSNDSGSFAYNFKENKVIVNKNDCSSEIQYAENANYILCDAIIIGEEEFSTSGTGTYENTGVGTLKYSVTKDTSKNVWNLKIEDIYNIQKHSSIYSLPISGKYKDKIVGSLTFKMTGLQDWNASGGVYAYRILAELPFSSDSGGDDYLDVKVFREALIEGPDINNKIKVALVCCYKDDVQNPILVIPENNEVSCGKPVAINTGITFRNILNHKGLNIKVYVSGDGDYGEESGNNDNIPNTDYYYTGECEDIAYTVNPTSLSEIKDLLKDYLNDLAYNFIGQAPRIREWESGVNYFPIISDSTQLDALQNLIGETLKDSDDVVTHIYKQEGGGSKNVYVPKFYDIVSYENSTYLCIKYTNTADPSNSDYWKEAESYNFIKANAAYIKDLAAKNVNAEKILINDGTESKPDIVAGIINGEDEYAANSSGQGTKVRIFAGNIHERYKAEDAIPGDKQVGDIKRSDLELAPFRVYNDGTVIATKLKLGGDALMLQLEQSSGINSNILNYTNSSVGSPPKTPYLVTQSGASTDSNGTYKNYVIGPITNSTAFTGNPEYLDFVGANDVPVEENSWYTYSFEIKGESVNSALESSKLIPIYLYFYKSGKDACSETCYKGEYTNPTDGCVRIDVPITGRYNKYFISWKTSKEISSVTLLSVRLFKKDLEDRGLLSNDGFKLFLQRPKLEVGFNVTPYTDQTGEDSIDISKLVPTYSYYASAEKLTDAELASKTFKSFTEADWNSTNKYMYEKMVIDTKTIYRLYNEYASAQEATVSFESIKSALDDKESGLTLESNGNASINGAILAKELILAKNTETSVGDAVEEAAWFKFEEVNNILSPVLYWKYAGQEYKLDFSNIMLDGDGKLILPTK